MFQLSPFKCHSPTIHNNLATWQYSMHLWRYASRGHHNLTQNMSCSDFFVCRSLDQSGQIILLTCFPPLSRQRPHGKKRQTGRRTSGQTDRKLDDYVWGQWTRITKWNWLSLISVKISDKWDQSHGWRWIDTHTHIAYVHKGKQNTPCIHTSSW